MSRSFVAIALFSFMALAQAATLVKDNVDVVITVRITTPNAQTTWVVGTVQEVEWNIPAISFDPSTTAKIVLGYVDNNSENLCLDSPLATNVPVNAGKAMITVPNVKDGDKYIVDFFGDSGDKSDQFTITGGNSDSRC
ncbi:hypothetical protein BGW80DRAFT_1200049 [Lactifluus volemus]|nr:hypothetical protein BGW80DRAFT_1200049 [Lactifluus volemus]